MELKKISLLLTFIVILSNFGVRGNQSHHLIVGSRIPGDSDMTRDYIYIVPELMKIITFEKNITLYNNYKITKIAAYDQKRDGTGAYAFIISGGLGFQYVVLKFISQRGFGIDFVVELFGR